jgi:hypothetical protein
MTEQERYVRELERRLPFALGLRRRALAEVREHLRDDGEDALARFGPVDEVAPKFAAELRLRAAARASWLAALLLPAFLVALYGIPENTLPPAPWPVKPHYLAWKQEVSVVSFLIALAFALLAVVVGRIRPSLAFVPLLGVTAALALAVAFGSIVAIQWVDAVPDTSVALMYGTVALMLLLVAAAAYLTLEALPHRRHELAAD